MRSSMREGNVFSRVHHSGHVDARGQVGRKPPSFRWEGGPQEDQTVGRP